VQRAVPNGIVGPFVEEGQPMETLLNELKQQPEHADLVQLLLAAFPPTYPLTAPAVLLQELPEPLTERERSILELLANRLSNKEIAQQLILSPHTVRNHMANIFGKLQVENRLQAVERARSLGLLPHRN
jgi:LuxR family maltose regulon positive regulatory protein